MFTLKKDLKVGTIQELCKLEARWGGGGGSPFETLQICNYIEILG